MHPVSSASVGADSVSDFLLQNLIVNRAMVARVTNATMLTNLRPKGPKSEIERPRARVRFLRRGSQRHPHQLEVWVSVVSYPGGVRNGAPAAKRFARVLNVQSSLARQFSVVHCSLLRKNFP